MRFARDLAETEAWGVHLLCGVNDIGRNEGVFVPVEEICRTLAGMLDEARALGVKAWIGSLTLSIVSEPWARSASGARAPWGAYAGALLMLVVASVALDGAGLRFIDKTSGNRLLSEDYHFCKISRQMGIKIWAAPWVNLKHCGTYNFSGQLARTK